MKLASLSVKLTALFNRSLVDIHFEYQPTHEFEVLVYLSSAAPASF